MGRRGVALLVTLGALPAFLLPRQEKSLRSGRRPLAGGAISDSPRGERLLRRGLPEAALLGGVALLGALRPKSAPGISQELQQANREAKKEVQKARQGPRGRLQEALKKLSLLEAQIEAAKGDEEEYPVPEYLEAASKSGKIMLAITGSSGVGKSSLVNALRKLRDTDSEAAETGIQETTLEPMMYNFKAEEGLFNQRFYRRLQEGEKLRRKDRVVLTLPDGVSSCGEVLEVKHAKGPSHAKHEATKVRLEDDSVLEVDTEHVAGIAVDVAIWDLPGAGTPNYPQATYVRRMGIRYYDVVLLVTSSRFTEAELMLAEELKRVKVPFFMVRNKVDVDIQSEILKEEESYDDDRDLTKEEKHKVTAETLGCIKDYFKLEYGLDKVYCVSSRRKLHSKWDFPSLERDILEAIRMQRG